MEIEDLIEHLADEYGLCYHDYDKEAFKVFRSCIPAEPYWYPKAWIIDRQSADSIVKIFNHFESSTEPHRHILNLAIPDDLISFKSLFAELALVPA